jgi:hypothetical protein
MITTADRFHHQNALSRRGGPLQARAFAAYRSSMIFSENRYPLFGIML